MGADSSSQVKLWRSGVLPRCKESEVEGKNPEHVTPETSRDVSTQMGLCSGRTGPGRMESGADRDGSSVVTP